MNDFQKRALQYVKNTGYSATPEQFDDDHEPIGPALRTELMPKYMRANSRGKIELTDAGFAILVPA